MKIKVIKGSTAKNLLKIDKEVGSIGGFLEVEIGELPPFVYENPVFPLYISLSKEQTQMLNYENQIIISEYIGEDRIIYNKKAAIYAYDAPVDFECEFETQSLSLCDCNGTENIINLVVNEIPVITSPDESIFINKVGNEVQLFSQGTGGGTLDHSKLLNREKENQHPISAIYGLQDIIDDIYKKLGGYIPPEPPAGESSFNIVNGELIMTYDEIPEFDIQGVDLIYTYTDGTTPKNYSINSSGDLILTE